MPDETEIQAIINKFLGFKKDRPWVELSFFGGNFLGLAPEKIQRLLAAAAPWIASGEINGIRFSTRPDTIDSQRLALIRPYPVTTVELGVQSMDPYVLRRASRGHSPEDTVRAVSLLKAESCRIGLQMMTGLPGDDDATCIETARRIIALKPDMVRIYPTLVLSGSPLAMLYQRGKYQPQPLKACVNLLKTLYLMFHENKIAVIRMGLQASEGLDDPATVLAGPYHPALGHMVYSRIFLDAAAEKIQKIANVRKPAPMDAVTLGVHPRNLSRMQGLKKTNLTRLKQRFHLQTLIITTDPDLAQDLEQDAIIVTAQ